jgi:hypothetical protein
LGTPNPDRNSIEYTPEQLDELRLRLDIQRMVRGEIPTPRPRVSTLHEYSFGGGHNCRKSRRGNSA